MRRKILLSMTAAALLAGCTTFSHPTKTEKHFAQDRRDCERYVEENPSDPNATCSKASTTCATCEDVKRCLVEQKGWKRVSN